MMSIYKEKVKSGVNPVIAVVLWFAGIYLFNIIWGVAQILFEFNLTIVKHFCALGITIAFGWFFVSKILTEYEFEISAGKFTVKRILAKREKLVNMVATANIKLVTDSKTKFESIPKNKVRSYTRPKQKGKTIYILYKNDDKTDGIIFKTSAHSKKQIESFLKGNSDCEK